VIALSIPEGTPRPSLSSSAGGRGVIALSRASHRASHPAGDPAGGHPGGDLPITGHCEPPNYSPRSGAEWEGGEAIASPGRLPPLGCARGRLCPSLPPRFTRGFGSGLLAIDNEDGRGVIAPSRASHRASHPAGDPAGGHPGGDLPITGHCEPPNYSPRSGAEWEGGVAIASPGRLPPLGSARGTLCPSLPPPPAGFLWTREPADSGGGGSPSHSYLRNPLRVPQGSRP